VLSAKAGRKTLLLEKKKFPRDKYCGDAVCKTGIEILDEMGIYQQLVDDNKAKIVSTAWLLYTALSSVTYLKSVTATGAHLEGVSNSIRDWE